VAVENKDADRTSQRLAAALGGVARLELLQAPGLAFTPPRQYDSLPRLLGEAVRAAGLGFGGMDLAGLGWAGLE
jgi:hypothetical protein